MAMIEPSRSVKCQTCRKVFGKLSRVATSPAGRSRRSADGNMVWMAVAAIGSEGNHDVGTEGANDFDHLPDQHFLINFPQHAVAVFQAQHVLDSQSLAGQTKFLFTHLAERAPCRNLRTADLPCLSPGRGDNHCLGTRTGLPGKGPSRAEAFII